jgi:hypothetical protein
MATQKRRQAARKNVKKAQAGARQKKTITKLPKKTRSALGREGAKAAARKRGATKGTGTGAGAMTVTELRREAARLGIDGRSKMGKAQLIRAVGQTRRPARKAERGSIKSARATPSGSPSAESTAAPACRFRPSVSIGHAITTCSSPAGTGASIRAARRASTPIASSSSMYVAK